MKKTLAVMIMLSAALMAQGPRGRGPGGPPPGGGAFGGGRGMGGFGPGRVVTGAPYSGTVTETFQESLQGGNSISRKTTKLVYRDGQGRTREETTVTPAASTGKAAYKIITINDIVGGYRYMADSSTMTYSLQRTPVYRAGTIPTTTTTTTTLPTTSTNASTGATTTTSSLGSSVINGVTATGTQTVEVIPVGAIGNTQAITVTRSTWISTDLKVPVRIQSSDPRWGTSDMELTGIAQGEPSAALFGAPAGYTLSASSHGPSGASGSRGGSGRPGPGFGIAGPGGPGGGRRGGPH